MQKVKQNNIWCTRRCLDVGNHQLQHQCPKDLGSNKNTEVTMFDGSTCQKRIRIKFWGQFLPFTSALCLLAYSLNDFQHHDGKSQKCTFLFCKPLQRSFLQTARAQLQHRSPSPAASVQSEQQVWLATKSCMIRNQRFYFHLEGVVSNTGNHLEVARHFHVDQTLLKWRGDLRIKPCLQIT